MTKKKDYATAILLNLFLPGAGYIYAGRVFLGVLVLLMSIGASVGYAMGVESLAGVVGFFAIIGGADGYLTVKKFNEKAEAGDRMPCPACGESIARGAQVCRFCQRKVA
jgi:TM2 domain-containing membrane protein YozV